MAAWTLVLIGWAFAIIMMTALWAVQRARDDAGVLDVGWAAGLGVIAVIYAVLAGGAWPQALASRGDDYRDHHGTTSMFVPWFPKRMSP